LGVGWCWKRGCLRECTRGIWGRCLKREIYLTELNFISELAIADLKANTLMGYHQKVNHFLVYCERNFFHNPLDKEALETRQLWRDF
jgi:hypothetical protein